MNIEDVLRRHEDTLMALANVTAVGVGEKAGRPVIMVHVTKKVPIESLANEMIVPSSLEGFDVVVAEIGTITAPGPQSNEEDAI